MNNIYIFQGVANVPEMFKKYKIFESATIINYPELSLKDNDELYLKKLTAQIKNENPILVGVSLGGVMAIQVSQYIKPKILFLISSAENRKEISWWIKILVYLKPSKEILMPFSQFSLIFMKKRTREIVKTKLQKTNQNFLNLVYKFFEKIPKDISSLKIIRIHGKKDQFFPFKKIKNLNYVLPGGHFLVNEFQKEITKILEENLNN